tara:strand:+ start:331 stop:1014 length:684 start_codon:yes stop_codon:yes gene_type:complete
MIDYEEKVFSIKKVILNLYIMKFEFEYRYYGYDKSSVLNKIKDLNGVNVNPSRIIKNIVLRNKTKMLHRLRTEDDTNYLYTQKIQNFKKFDKEIEMRIVNTDEKTILEMFRNTKLYEKYRVEKMREKWIIPYNNTNVEVVFDIYPGTPEYCEIEAKTLEDLENLEKELNLKDFRFKGGMKHLMKKVFGINYNKIDFKDNMNNITFKNIEVLKEKVLKNQDKFKEMFL